MQRTRFRRRALALSTMVALLIAQPALVAPLPAAVPQLKITGPEFVIFDWQTERCEDQDLADKPFRALRLANGEIFASGDHYLNMFLRGRDFRHLKKTCHSSYRGSGNPSPAAFDDRTWLMSFWTPDGVRITALGHNEYHADKHAACRFSGPWHCNYDAVVAAESSDGGRSFTRAAALPIAAPRYRQDGSLGRIRGFLHPSNIVGDGHFFYAIIQADPDPPQSEGACLFRTTDPLTPQAWTYLATTGAFVTSSSTPYAGGAAPSPCQRLARLNGIVWSLLRLDDGRGYLALLTVPVENKLQTGIALAVSRDLTTWSKPNVVMTIVSAWNNDPAAPLRYNYPSLIDPASPSRNFDTIGHAALLTMARIHMDGGHATLQRDVVATPVALEPGP